MRYMLQNSIELLNKNNIRYFVYKGFSHLDIDLNLKNMGHDIDLWIHPKDLKSASEILLKNSFHKLYGSNKSFIFFDHKNNGSLIFDICSKIRLGPEPYKPYYLDFNYEDLSLVKRNNLYCLADNEYYPLQFLIRMLSIRDKGHSIREIEKYYADEDNKFQETKFNRYLYGIAKTNHFEIKELVNKGSFISKKDRFANELKSNLNKNIFAILKSKLKFQYDIKLLFYRLTTGKLIDSKRDGKFVVFQGVDGSGKSSCINFLENQIYFKYSGLKSIYFGNNDYSIPFLKRFLNIRFNSKFINFLKYILVTIDRQSRIVKVIYYKKRGFLVLGDRYFYDDLIYSKYNPGFASSNLMQLLRKILRKRIIIKPDILFFMDVSPEVAYKRKQDYSYEKMKIINRNYKEFFKQLQHVSIERIDADNDQKTVQSNVLEIILNKLRIQLD